MTRTLVSAFVLLTLMSPGAQATNINKGKVGDTEVIAAAPADGAPAPLNLSEADRADLKRVEEYFNSMPTVQAKFLQTAEQQNGTTGTATGTFKLWRPGRLRIDYDNNYGDFIVADGHNIYAWDGEMQSQSQTSIDDNIAGLLLRPDFSFSRDVTLTNVSHPTPQRMEISVRSAKDPNAGELTLVMNDYPFGLTSWRVLDGQGLTTVVELKDVEQGLKFDKSDFVFRKPAVKRGGK